MYKERSHCVDVHIVRGVLSNSNFKGVTAPGLNFFFEKYLVSATLAKFFVQCAREHIAKEC
jgi:hypothetical protein